MKDDWSELEQIKEQITCCFKSAIAGGIDKVDTKEAGEVVDMIKDLAMADKYCWEKKYYKTVVEAMEEGSEPKYGYGQYPMHTGPKYRGSYGYKPYIDQEPYIDGYLNDGEFKERMRLGYMDDTDREYNRYGRAYNEYKMAKRHYTETNSMNDKDAMNTHAHEHMSDVVTSILDIWKSADTDLKRKIKNDISNLMTELTV